MPGNRMSVITASKLWRAIALKRLLGGVDSNDAKPLAGEHPAHSLAEHLIVIHHQDGRYTCNAQPTEGWLNGGRDSR